MTLASNASQIGDAPHTVYMGGGDYGLDTGSYYVIFEVFADHEYGEYTDLNMRLDIRYIASVGRT